MKRTKLLKAVLSTIRLPRDRYYRHTAYYNGREFNTSDAGVIRRLHRETPDDFATDTMMVQFYCTGRKVEYMLMYILREDHYGNYRECVSVLPFSTIEKAAEDLEKYEDEHMEYFEDTQ